jgi:predicted CopG family antitoxin
MRPTTKTKFVRISVTEDIYKRLLQDRQNFQEVINGGKWSISDTINEYLKILNTLQSKSQKSKAKFKSTNDNDVLCGM